ncbi:hypothetical protein MNBD_PLANCTO02-2414 [hydrothermal vent metagenome]|uniref:Uncharacterized protein n=1 Tax=hydrothermal vent metagenome TaxID=652676 RepID=A0A3B1DFA7_9ZZZZ
MQKQPRHKYFLFFLLFTFLTSGLFAQEKKEEKPTVFIPYKNLKTVINKKNATVIMPYAEYLRLLKKAGDGTQKEQGPSAVITAATYKGHVAKDQAKVIAHLTVQVLGNPWVSLPIQFGDAAIGKVTHQGEGDVLLQGTGNGKYALLFSKKGTFEITLQLTARVLTSPEGRQFSLACPTSGITQFELTVPQADQTVEVTPKPVLLPVKKSDEKKKVTTIKATLGSTNKIAARWFPRLSTKPEMNLLTSVNNQQQILIADGMIHTTAKLQYKILRGEMNQLRIAIPLGHRILDVAVPDARMKSWKTTSDTNRQVVAIHFLGTLKEKLTVEVHTEVSAPSGPFEISGINEDGKVHGIHAIDAVREGGGITLSYEEGVNVAVEEKQGVVRVAAGEFSGRGSKTKKSSRKLFYKYFNPKFLLKVSIRPVKPQLAVVQDVRLTFRDDELQLQTNIHCQIERAGLFELRYKIPENLIIDNVSASAKMEQSFDKTTHILTLTFPEKQTSTVQVGLKAHRNLDSEKKQGDQQLPIIEPLSTTRETGTIYLFAQESIEIVTDEKRLAGVYPVSKTVSPPNAQTRLIATWEYSRRPVTVFVKTVRKPTRISATLGTTVNVKQEQLHISSLLNYHVQYAGVDTFRIEVPEKVAESIHIEIVNDGKSVPIKQTEKDEAAKDGFLGITIQTQRLVLGTQQFEISYDITAEENSNKKEEEKKGETLYKKIIPLLRVVDIPNETEGEKPIPVSRLQGEIIIQKERALTVTATAEGSDIEQIDIRELIHLKKEGTLAYRYFKQPATLALIVKKYDIQEVVQTVVSRALTEVIIGRDPQATYRCRYRITTSERQRLKIFLPAGAELQGVFIDRKEVSLEKDASGKKEEGWDSYSVNVTRTKNTNESLLLSIQFVWAGYENAFGTWGRNLFVRLPRIGDNKDRVVLQEQRCLLWIPEKYSLVGTPKKFHPLQTHHLKQVLFGEGSQFANQQAQQWIGTETANLFDFPTEGHHAYAYSRLGRSDSIEVTSLRIPYLTAVVSGALLLLALVLISLNWEKKLLLLLIAIFCLALYSLRDADWATHILAAASYGLIAMLGVWLIHALFYSKDRYNKKKSSLAVATGDVAETPATASPPSKNVEKSKPDSSDSSSKKEEDKS